MNFMIKLHLILQKLAKSCNDQWGLTQLVECRTVNSDVTGSKPVSPANYRKGIGLSYNVKNNQRFYYWI